MHSELKEINQQQYLALNALLEKGRWILGFPRELEQQYSQHIRKKILQRVPMVGISSIGFLLLFAVLDQFMMPTTMAHVTATVRIVIVCPAIFVCCIWLYLRPPKLYLVPYGFAFLLGSLSVVWVIWLAHKEGVLLPYEGLMITMMYGFVVLGLPLLFSCLLNAVVLLVYIFTEPFYILSFNTYVNNVMFLSAMYLAGFISALILSHSQRSQFLQQSLLNLSEERSRIDLEAKNRYLAVASHDLRQPLQAINMMSTQLCETSDDKNLKKLNAASHALNNMFTQLLDASKINLDLIHVNIEPINLARFFEHIITPYTFSYAKKGMNLNYDKIDSWVLSDYACLQRIVNNLLQNALVHSGASDVYVKAIKDDSHLKLIIKDNGCGILDADKDSAFEEFTQLNVDSSNQGLGVGLSIVKRLTKALDHNMDFHSFQGCEFVIYIPLCEGPVGNVTSPEENGNTVLIIEDDEQLIQQYQTWFENWGWNIEIASHVQKAIMLLEKKPVLVMTDWNLPDGCADTVLNKIHSMMDYEPDIIIVSENENLKEKMKVPCQYFVKPITASRLRAAVQLTV